MPFQSHPFADRRRPITVALVDDERLIRAALGQMLMAAGLELVGEAANATDAIELVLDLRPDVVLIDIRLPGISGVQRDRAARAARPRLTRTGAHPLRREPRRRSDPRRRQRLHPQNRAAQSDHRRRHGNRRRRIRALLPIAGKLLQRIREREIPIAANSQDAANAIRAVLTERELEIFTKLASGKNNHDIARELSLSTNTVANHIASILAKLHLENRVQAAVQAVRTGIS